MRILGIVSIKISNSLLFMVSREPIPNEILNLSNIHKLNVIYMTILLSFDHYVRRDTFVAHRFGVGLMILTSSINFIPHLRRWQTVVALYVSRMHSFAFEFPLSKPIIEWNVSSICNELIVKAMNALSIGSMLTKHFGSFFFVLWINCSAVQASPSWSVITFGSILFFLAIFWGLFGLISTTDTVEATTSRGMIAFGTELTFPL